MSADVYVGIGACVVLAVFFGAVYVTDRLYPESWCKSCRRHSINPLPGDPDQVRCGRCGRTQYSSEYYANSD